MLDTPQLEKEEKNKQMSQWVPVDVCYTYEAAASVIICTLSLIKSRADARNMAKRKKRVK